MMKAAQPVGCNNSERELSSDIKEDTLADYDPDQIQANEEATPKAEKERETIDAFESHPKETDTGKARMRNRNLT